MTFLGRLSVSANGNRIHSGSFVWPHGLRVNPQNSLNLLDGLGVAVACDQPMSSFPARKKNSNFVLLAKFEFYYYRTPREKHPVGYARVVESIIVSWMPGCAVQSSLFDIAVDRSEFNESPTIITFPMHDACRARRRQAPLITCSHFEMGGWMRPNSQIKRRACTNTNSMHKPSVRMLCSA